MTVLYFTATGNGLYLAKTIGGTLISIPKAVKEGKFKFKDEKMGLVFPIYGWAVPEYIREFIKLVKLDSPYIFAVMSYGMMAGAAVDHLVTLGQENGIHFSYVNTLRMTDNYLPLFKMELQTKHDYHRKLKAIAADIQNGKQKVPGNSFLTKWMTKNNIKSGIDKIGTGIARKVRVEDSCTFCGTCAKVCPSGNIKADGAKPVWRNKCVNCLACAHHCPQNAIRLSNEKSRARYRNPHVSLQEIIDANN